MRYIASCSFGKDSLAMILRLIEDKERLDEVIFYDTGMEFQAIYNLRDKVKDILSEKGIIYTELKPENPFIYDMTERTVKKRNGTIQSGYGWCGGACRWGTYKKIQAINKYLPKDKSQITMYVGIAIDEPNRLEKLDSWKQSPLAKWKMTESDCLEYCRAKGYSWEENGIDLYNILDRVSCWCCRNKNQKELKNIYLYMPKYWEQLKDLQNKIGHNMKKYRTDKVYGDLGDLYNLEKMWKNDKKQMTLTEIKSAAGKGDL